jgi:hypothetical protein
MHHNRVIQIVAALVAVACIGVASLLGPTISRKRAELQLTFTPEVGQEAPPHIALLTSALGSFRGLLVDVMFYRLEMLKREGKFNEADSLSQWIAQLSPRFAQLWSFMAWNMAYNISVETYTPQERWDWVSKGINLLRDQGIPYNPYAIRLYRELGWIYFHKVGQFSDDQHWFYKRRMAEQWQTLLGDQAQGGATEQVMAAFRPIAQAWDRYLNQQRPARSIRERVDQLIAVSPQRQDELTLLRDLPLGRFALAITDLRRKLGSDEPAAAELVDQILDQVQRQQAHAGRDPVAMLSADEPTVGPIVARLGELGIAIDDDLNHKLGRVLMLVDSPDATLLGYRERALVDAQEQALYELLADAQTRRASEPLLALLRARALARLHMDPDWMLYLMEQFGPLDWRQSYAHSLYWSSLGVRLSAQVLGLQAKNIDVLNTDRQVIHSLQSLMHFGRLSYDPVSGYLDLLPDPRFIKSYETAVLAASDQATNVWGEYTGETFAAGYENFLLKAIVFSYMYGDRAQAQAYYDKTRALFASKPHNLMSGRYLKTLDRLVTDELTADIDQMVVARQTIDALLQQGIREGLANNRLNIYQGFGGIARQVYDRFQEKAMANPTAVQDRMKLPPWARIESDTYLSLMRADGVPMLARARVWRNTPLPLQQAVYDRLFPAVKTQIEQTNQNLPPNEPAIDPALAFPAPLDMDAYRAAHPSAAGLPPEDESQGIRIQRQ